MNMQRSDLRCHSCKNEFYILDGLPILLIEDENWQMKKDEINGEVQYNTKIIPMEVHIERNAFVDANSELFFEEAEIDLSGKEVLAVGCSMAELKFYSKKSDAIVCLDIVPKMAKACQQATVSSNIVGASWVCGDGECLPFENESFDFVIIRQTLHHMLKYYSAISEFFRACRVGGGVLIIDEPFAAFTSNDTAMNPTQVEEILTFISSKGSQKYLARLRKQPLNQKVEISTLEKETQFIAADPSNPETLLADKYHNFSLLNCIYSIMLHTRDLFLSWPRETAWTDSSGDVVKFCHGPNPNVAKPLLERLVEFGNVSIMARKTEKTLTLRKRKGIRSISYARLNSLL
jgi:ubiquinone/menaquinone biosynthesis C-methylase UbiE